MKRQPRNRNRAALDVAASAGRNADAPRHPPLNLSNIVDPAPKNREYLVPMHFVITPDAPAPAGGMAARIPWLEEIRSEQCLPGLHSEIS